MPRPIVTIDGPAGAGKSTVSRSLAAELGYTYLDTGAIYRTLGLAVTGQGALASRLDSCADPEALALEDREQLASCARSLAITFADAGTCVFLAGEEVTTAIRTPASGERASRVSAVPEVRAALLELQRTLGRDGGVVVEGRDTGSIVFPEAEAKFFLTATVACRARRRTAELHSRGMEAEECDVAREISVRDARDVGRSVAPLVHPKGAIEVDSSNLGVAEVVQEMATRVRALEAS
jgi:cytidylate kinase